MPAVPTFAIQLAASDPELADSPRQICPPRAGLSSTTPTRTPICTADVAAAIPAGPPPTINTSNCSLFLLISSYLHACHAQHLTTSAMQYSVYFRTAFKADSHSAQRAPRLTAHRRPAVHASQHHGRCHGCSSRYCDPRSVHADCYLLRHARAPASQYVTASTAPAQYQNSGSLTDRPEAGPSQAML